MDEAPKKIFIFGVGYVGKYLAKSLIRAGHFVLGTSSEKHEGIYCFDLRDPTTHKEIISKIESCDSVVVTIPPVKGKDIVQPILNKHGVKPKQVIYCSSTGVYKNTDGNYVDELGEICFESNLSRARFEAEQSWLQNFHAVRLRLSGIYGPNRNLISSFMRAPIKIVSGKENHFFNRVHVQDIIEIIHKIIDLKIVNEVINVMGLTFCQRQVASTGATVGEVIRAYVVVRDVLGLDRVWRQVELLDYKVSAEVQFELFHALMRLGRRTSRWMLRNRRSCHNPQQEVQAFGPKLVELQLLLPTLFSRQESSGWMEEVDRIVAQGVQQNIAVLVASSNFLYFGFGIADIAVSAGKPVGLVLELYHRISTELDLDWFADQIVNLEPSTRWEDFARESYVDDLENQRRSLTFTLLSNVHSAKDIEAVIDVWKAAQAPLVARWGEMTQELHAVPNGDFAMFSVALRELLDIVQSTEIRPDSPPICLI